MNRVEIRDAEILALPIGVPFSVLLVGSGFLTDPSHVVSWYDPERQVTIFERQRSHD